MNQNFKKFFIFYFIPFLFFILFVYIFFPVYVKDEKVDIYYAKSKSDAFNILSKRGIVRTSLSLKIISFFYNKPIGYGEYRFNGFISPFYVYKKLLENKFYLYKVTIPEGFDSFDIANRLSYIGICKKEAFLKAVNSKALMDKLGLKGAPSFEGYMFPSTYFFYKHEDPKDIVEIMYKAFLQKTKGLPINNKIITIASIVEKETPKLSEKSLVASVIYNRLRLDMPLQMDSTVIYALKREGKWSGKLTPDDLKIKDPYNTYYIKGLPPGPICNPGINSIKAAINPAKTDYLYFVANPGYKSHTFSKTYISHERAILKLIDASKN